MLAIVLGKVFSTRAKKTREKATPPFPSFHHAVGLRIDLGKLNRNGDDNQLIYTSRREGGSVFDIYLPNIW